MMEKDEKTAFYLNIPLFMHNCPHMFLMQQNMMAQQQQMQRQMAGQGAGIRSSESSATSNSNSTSTSTSTSIASGNVTHEPGHQMMSEMLSDPDSRTRLTALSARVTGKDNSDCYYCYCYCYCYHYCYCYCYHYCYYHYYHYYHYCHYHYCYFYCCSDNFHDDTY